MSKLSIVIPCYNEQEAVPLYYQAVIPVLCSMACGYELLFVDDGSTDGTLAVLKELADRDGNVAYISFSRNFGKEAAMYAGFCHADGDYVATMDVDLQDPPALLPEMLRLLESGEYECVAARRVSRTGEKRLKSWLARGFYWLINKISEVEIVDGARDFRMMKRNVADAVVSMDEYNRFSKGIFGWVGFRTGWLEYENVERAAGRTKWSLGGLFRYALDGIINFSQMPLAIASWFGVLMTALAVLALLFIVIRKLIFGDPVAGWASMVCIVILIGGIELFCIGIAGQYIAKMYLEIKRRPHYIVSEANRQELR